LASILCPTPVPIWRLEHLPDTQEKLRVFPCSLYILITLQLGLSNTRHGPSLLEKNF
jgi:hypothetical protein